MRILAVAFASLILLFPVASHAQDCSFCSPARYATVVEKFPTNGIVRFRVPGRTDLSVVSKQVELREAGGATVPASFRHHPSPTYDSTWYELVPDRPLAPGTEHLLLDFEQPSGQSEWVRFTTGAGADHEAPEFTLKGAECRMSCGDRSGCANTASGFYVWLDFGLNEAISIEATARGIGFEPEPFELTQLHGYIALAGPLHLKGDGCEGVHPPLTIDAPKGQLVVQLTAIDLAGNRAPAESAVLIEHTDCRCTARLVPPETAPQPVELAACPADGGRCLDLTGRENPEVPEPQPPFTEPDDYLSCGCSAMANPAAASLGLLALALGRRRRRS